MFRRSEVTRNSIEVDATPEDVFDVLSDPTTYPDWLVGAKAIRSIDPDWPAPGSQFHHRIGLGGPLTIPGSTTVRRSEPPDLLVLGAGMGILGEALVRFRLKRRTNDSGEPRTQLEIEETPRKGIVRGAFAALRPLVLAGLWGRNEVSLSSLAGEVESRRAKARSSS
jgi:uncharacterized protein YndB with AHSA1/START domain